MRVMVQLAPIKCGSGLAREEAGTSNILVE